MFTHRERRTPRASRDLGQEVQSQTSDLAMLGVTLSLVQAACALALEGVNRASVTEVVQRAHQDTGVQVMPPTAGQIFSTMGIRTVTSHGKNRLVINHDELLRLRETLAAQWEEIAPRAEQYLSKFDEMAERVKKLEGQRQMVLGMIEREKSNREFLKSQELWFMRNKDLDQKVQNLHKVIARCGELERQSDLLEKTIKVLPRLVNRKAKLDAKLDRYRQKEQELLDQEAQLRKQEEGLGDRLVDLKARLRYVKVDQLEQDMERASNELESLSEQLGEKKGRLARLLGKGGSSP